MQITLQLGNTGEDIDVDLPAVPRIGEQILWADEVTDDHGTYERLREYRVEMVDWTLSRTNSPFVMVRLAYMRDNSGPPAADASS
ncbi:hypothetical protein [Streptomyces achromogenes]|uniref:hypothetical protein n=1 Tax=Streptomyces achromogenes TaxID=67255 RepID=UPI003700CA32